MPCEVRIGKLISHPCGRKSTDTCGSCGRQICKRHRVRSALCGVCDGAIDESTAALSVDEVGDPLDFAPEVFSAFDRRAGAPEDELAGVDS